MTYIETVPLGQEHGPRGEQAQGGGRAKGGEGGGGRDDIESYLVGSGDHDLQEAHDLRHWNQGHSDSDSEGDSDVDSREASNEDADGDTDAARLASLREEDTLENIPEDGGQDCHC